MMKWTARALCGAVLLMPLSVAGPASGEDGDAALRQEVGELRRALERLDARVQSLEQRASGPSGSEPAAGSRRAETAPTAARLRDQWRDVKQGMTVEQIEALLGRPDRTVKLPSKTVWYYAYPDAGNASVIFGADGSVTDWQSPPFNTWWGF